MARFAKDILSRFHILSKELEVTLGPDTGDLALRIGMHSGPGKTQSRTLFHRNEESEVD